MSIPTQSEEYAKLVEHLRLAQESAAMLAHLANAQGSVSTVIGRGWLHVEDNLKKMGYIVTKLAQGKLQ